MHRNLLMEFPNSLKHKYTIPYIRQYQALYFNKNEEKMYSI